MMCVERVLQPSCVEGRCGDGREVWMPAPCSIDTSRRQTGPTWAKYIAPKCVPGTAQPHLSRMSITGGPSEVCLLVPCQRDRCPPESKAYEAIQYVLFGGRTENRSIAQFPGRGGHGVAQRCPRRRAMPASICSTSTNFDPDLAKLDSVLGCLWGRLCIGCRICGSSMAGRKLDQPDSGPNQGRFRLRSGRCSVCYAPIWAAGGESRGPGAIHRIMSGSRNSPPRPKSELEQRNIAHNQTLTAHACPAD